MNTITEAPVEDVFLRDTMLPKLESGARRVCDVSKFMEAMR